MATLRRRPEPFGGRTALITGGGSGIGRALGAELASRGARVVLADVDGESAARAADEIAANGGAGSSVVGRLLDVRDRQAFRALVDEVAARDGALDFLFNNAGISIGGSTHELTGPHWDRVMDVNLGGVVNGVLTGYPRMVQQGHGHIVNTASLAGLAGTPLVVAYSTTKYAIVGLSASLRPEAALHGVRVSVLCPGAVETAILDQRPPGDLPATVSKPVTAREYVAKIGQKPVDAGMIARLALRDVARNKGMIVVPRNAKAIWYLQRLSPSLVDRVSRSTAKSVVKDLIRPA